MIQITTPPEIITGITNLINFLLAVFGLIYIKNLKAHDRLFNSLWFITFILVSIVSLLGAIVHGFVLDIFIYDTIWYILGLVMGSMVTSLTINTFYEMTGKKNLKLVVTVMLLIFAAYIFSWVVFSSELPNYFVIFAIYAGLNLFIDFIAFILISKRAAYIKWFALSLGIMIAGSIIQALYLEFTIFIKIDTNSIYHIALSISLIIAAIAIKNRTEYYNKSNISKL